MSRPDSHQNATFRLALAQVNLAVGDIIGNTRRMGDLLRQADARGIDVLVFPELSVCGYPPQDLLLRDDFLSACERAVDEIIAFSAGKNTAIVFGVPERALPASATAAHHGPALYNTALVVRNGRIEHKHRKQKLPNYAVFDEKRWFTPGQRNGLYRHRLNKDQSIHLGISVCEDIWGQAEPVRKQVDMGAQLLINLSASPFARDKAEQRLSLLRNHARQWQRGIAYCNLVGAQDGLVFDGASPFVAPDGQSVSCSAFQESLLTVTGHYNPEEKHWDWTETDVIPLKRAAFLKSPALDKDPDSDPARLYAAMTLALADYFRKSGFKRAWIGLSGGIDSALTAALAAQALGPENVTGVLMPSRYSSDHSLTDAKALAENLGIETRTLPIEPVFSAYLKSLEPVFGGKESDLTEENLQARIRGNLLMALANKHGGLVLATGNKSELAVGYSTLYGDMAGAFAPLKDLYKTDVYAVARWLNRHSGRAIIPENTLAKAPSAELRPEQKDADSLPDYDTLDAILRELIEHRRGVQAIIARGFDPDTVHQVAQLLRVNEHKRFQAPPGPRLSSQAFDSDRRMPLSHAFDWRLW